MGFGSTCRVFGFGQPILDILVEIDKRDLYERYELKLDDGILAKKQHMPLYYELERDYDCRYETGGAGLNTIKMVQWISREPFACTYIGCIAPDEPGRVLKEQCENLQLDAQFHTINDGSESGKCAILLHNKYRSMVTHLGASQKLSLHHIKTSESWKCIRSAEIYYIEGYAIHTSFECVMELARYARSAKKLFCFNFGAPYILTNYTNIVDAVLPYVDILFANKAEVQAYGEAQGLHGQSVYEIAQHIAQIQPAGEAKNRIVVVTQETDPVIVSQRISPRVKEYPIPLLDDRLIVDTSGAGDAFAAGFLSVLLNESTIDNAVMSGLRAANYIIQRSGFSLGPRDQYS